VAGLAIYTRGKIEGKGWRYQRINEARGVKTGSLRGPFYIRPTQASGAQPWVSLDAETFDQAKTERDKKEKGAALAAENNAGRTLISDAVSKFMDQKRRKKSASTATNYEFILNEFQGQLPASIKFIDQVNGDVLDGYVKFLEGKDAAPKTIRNKVMVASFMLKAAGVLAPSKMIELPTVEEEIPEPYRREELKKLFAEMTDEERVRYTFFLDTACREKEVAHATWDDIKDCKYTVRAKAFKTSRGIAGKFTSKSHETRTIPLTRELHDMLTERKRNSNSKWIFPNEQGDPEGHFLRKFKKIAFKAGLNCGECHTSWNEGRYQKTVVEKCCKDYSEGCEKHYLHRLRKTCATFWHMQGISLRTIQYYLGHKSLATTQRYLGIQYSAEIQGLINAPKY
jgi:integrase